MAIHDAHRDPPPGTTATAPPHRPPWWCSPRSPCSAACVGALAGAALRRTRHRPGGSAASVASVTAAGKLDSVGRIDGSTASRWRCWPDGDQVSAYAAAGEAMSRASASPGPCSGTGPFFF